MGVGEAVTGVVLDAKVSVLGVEVVRSVSSACSTDWLIASSLDNRFSD